MSVELEERLVFSPDDSWLKAACSIGLNTPSSAATNSNADAIFVGVNAGSASTWSYGAIYIGKYAGTSSSYATYNIFIGNQCGYAAYEADYAVALGNLAGANLGGQYNIAIGGQTAKAANGDKNIYIGYYAGKACIGDENIEFVTNGPSTSILNGYSKKIHIANTIVGDAVTQRLAIGSVGSGDLSPDATLEIKPSGATDVGLIVQGATSQSANLTEWQDSSETVLAKIDSAGNLTATTKSFLIDHPTQEGKQLQYGSLEGPEHGVYVRGYTDVNTISLPDYWTELVCKDSLTVHLTPKDFAQPNLFVSGVIDNKIYLQSDDQISAYYTINGTRKDIGPLEVEI